MIGDSVRVVLDNNVLVSAALLEEAPRRVFDKVLENGRLLVSVPVMSELADVLSRAKFDKYVPYADRMHFLLGYLKVAELIEIMESITNCRDPRDNKLLELAVCGNAAFLVTGDNDLLTLSPFRGIEILQPQEFLMHSF